jgi:iron complex outermembrane receptor protein
MVEGRVVDGSTGRPLSHVNVYIPELRLGESSHEDGVFHLDHIAAGRWTLVASRVGYRDIRRSLVLATCDSLVLELVLQPSPMELEELRVTAEGTLPPEATLRLGSEELQRRLGGTLAATLDEQAGIASRSMGPAPARPVLRGLSGDRLQLQEDGHPVGDLSSTSADHAVAIDPASARSVTLMRGPEALVITGSGIGGVVDVQRGTIPPARAHGISASTLLSGESVSHTAVAGASLDAPLGSARFHLDGSWRSGQNQRTPVGRLGNSAITTGGLATGLRLKEGLGLEGLSLTLLDSEYGIPGGFVGAHPGGVDITMSRRNLLSRFLWHPDRPLVDRVEWEAGASRYHHREYEKSGRIGITFDVDNLFSRVVLHQGAADQPGAGQLGLEVSRRYLATGGLTLMPSVTRDMGALFLLKHTQAGPLALSGAARLALHRVAPDRERVSSVVGNIRDRRFSGSGLSLRAELPLARGAESAGPLRGLRVGTLLNRGWRAPTMEELFSGGPHLAAYSYEIGNPELQPETGDNAEIYLQVARQRLRGRLAVYATRWSGYIFPAFTGHFSSRRADLYEYRYTGRDATHRGWELELEWTPREPWTIHLEGAGVRGELASRNTPLPETPPIRGRFGVDWQNSLLRLGLALEGADRQDRVYLSEDPGATSEQATAGWARLDATLDLRFVRGGRLHSVMLAVDNLLDREYRDHLNRVRSVMPEAGRNLRLSWRTWF